MTARHYLTTPLYYVNARPHIGHVYTTVLVDTLTRFHRLSGDPVHFLTGTDEHGQKVMKAAEVRGLTPLEHATELSATFRDLWPTFHIHYDDFIRTTEPRHTAIVQRFLQQLWDQGDIYEADYEGWYSPAAERFWAAEELVDGKCPDTGLDVLFLKERNYFFKMSAYAPALRAHLEAHADFIQPNFRANEVLGFLDKGVADLCISRPRERLPWGIPIPFAPDYVTYVWFDALTNYVSALGGPGDPRFDAWWPSATHVIGKDILTTHAVYWSTMLLALGLPLPAHIVATGWWLAEDRKMSKSLGNAVDPVALRDRYGADALRYYLLRDMVIGLDANFSEAALVRRINSDLANDLGNLAKRAATLVERHFDAKVPDPGALGPAEAAVVAEAAALLVEVPDLIRDLALHSAIERILALVRKINKYITETEPFKTVKTDLPAAGRSLYVALEGLRIAAILLTPVMPVKMPELLAALGAAPATTLAAAAWGGLVPGTALPPSVGLFPRQELPAAPEAPPTPAAKPSAPPAPRAATPAPAPSADEASAEAVIDFETFLKVDLAVGTIQAAEAVAGSQKLLRLEVALTNEVRQIISGIAQHFDPDGLVGRQVVVVRNLAPRKIFKLESHGMILAAETPEGGLALLSPTAAVLAGTKIS